MTPSRRQQLLDAIVTKLEAIGVGYQNDIGAEFATDAGAAVYLGEAPELGTDDPDVAIAVLPREDEPTMLGQGLGWRVILPVDIQAISKASQENPWTPAEQVVADIKRAIETTDRTLEGLVLNIERGGVTVQPREPGGSTVNVSVLYRFTFKEVWGNP